MFDLFEKIDEKQTQKNVRHYLNYNLQRLLDICGISASQLKSPIITDMPTSKPNANRNEDKIIDLMKYRETLKIILQAIRSDEEHESILFYCYVKNLSSIAIMQKINVANAQYYRLKNKELLRFAESVITLVDLHAYK